MARIQVTTNFTDSELKIIEETARKLSLSKYKLIRAATLKYCEECLSDRGKSERENPKETGNDGSRNTSIEDIE